MMLIRTKNEHDKFGLSTVLVLVPVLVDHVSASASRICASRICASRICASRICASVSASRNHINDLT